MSRRDAGNDLGSLELLLDTICNVFGTIILITLLVSLMLTQSSRSSRKEPASAVKRAELLDAETRRDQLTRQLERARQQVAQRDAAKGVFASKDLVEQARRYREAQSRRAQAIASTSEAVGEASEAQEGLNNIAQRAADRQKEIEQAMEDLAKLRRQVDRNVAARSRDANIPKMSVTTRMLEQSYFLKHARLYGPMQHPDRSLNTEQFQLVEKDGINHVIEVLESGTPIDLKGGNVPSLSAQLSAVDPAVMDVTLWAWADSYEHFDPVRQAMEKRGIKYELIPMEDDATVRLSNEDRGPRNVQ